MTGLCPNCHQDNIQKASAIFSGGTAYTSGSISVSGQGGSSHSGGYGGTTQTHLAGRCSPPMKRNGIIAQLTLYYFVSIFALFWGTVILVIVGNWQPAAREILKAIYALAPVENGVARFFLLPLEAALLWLPSGIRNEVWNHGTFPVEYERWERRWYCHRCDQFFEV